MKKLFSKWTGKLNTKVQYKIGAAIFAAVLLASLANAWHGMQATTQALTEGAESRLANVAQNQKAKIEAAL